MAKVTITIEDTEGTGVHMTIESDPPFPGPANEDQTATNAQHLGLVAMTAMSKACGLSDDSNDDDSDFDMS